MSYEYRLVFVDNLSAQDVIDFVRSSGFYIRGCGDFIYLKEPSVKSEAPYDIRIIQEGNNSIWLEVGFRSPGLYGLLRSAIGDHQYVCLEDGDPNYEVPLYEAFRLKQIPS